MTAWVKCPSCRARNELSETALYCGKCGAKLDLSHVRFGEGPWAAMSLYVKRLIRVIVLVSLSAVLALLVWPTSPQGLPGTGEDGHACFEKLADLYEAINEGRALQRVFREEEVNGYFSVLLEEAATEWPESGRELNVRSINLSFTESYFVVHILAEWKFLRLTYEVQARPRQHDGRFDVEALRVSLGHLPVPGPLRQRFAGRLMPLFEQMEQERYVLDHLTQIDLGPQRARLRAGR